MIETISQILINNSQFIFGGAIYNARLNISYGDSQSLLRISVISETGEYSITPEDLENTYCNPYTIKIGEKITFTGFLDSYGESISPAGRTLDLEFVDNSRILDIINIGLYKRHGINSTKKLILVGKEIDACNEDGYADPLTEFYDPCNPCVNTEKSQALVNYIDCRNKNKYQINDVKYNFTELLQKINTIPITVIGAKDLNPKYLTKYTGSLREVLLSWCNDFGFFFYWDNGKIVFKDLRNTIQVNADIESFCPNVSEYTTNYSMKNSLKTATITNFTRPGDPAKFYNCQEAKYIECESLKQNSTYSMPLTISPKIDSIAAGLSYYSDDLRDLYYFYVKYQMYNESNFIVGEKLEKLGLTILSSQIKLGTLQGNGLNISTDAIPEELVNIQSQKEIISLDPFTIPENKLSINQQTNRDLIKANEDFYLCVQLLDVAHQWKIINNPNNYYFFVAGKNSKNEEKYLDEEKRFANFLNKYAVYVPSPDDDFFEDYDFTLDNLCNYEYFVNTGNVTYNALGDNTGNFTFYNTSSQGPGAGYGHIMGDLPFAEFLSIIRDDESGNSSNNQLQFKLIVAERGGNSFVPNGALFSDGTKQSIRDYDIISRAKEFLPYEAANRNNIHGALVSRLLSSADIDNYSDSDVYIYLGHAVTQDDFTITQSDAYNDAASFGTLFDGKPLNKESNPDDQQTEIIYQYPDLKCKIIGNHSYNGRTTLHANRVIFNTPLGQFKYTEPTDALFGLVIEKTKKRRRIVEKIESFNSTNLDSDDSCNFSKLKINYQNISDDRLSVLTKNESVCQFNTESIKTIHDDFSKNLSLNLTKPSITKTFRIAGLELNGFTPSIENGLISLEVGIDDKGVFSNYEFGTRMMRLPAEDALVFGKNMNLNSNPGSYSTTSNRFPLIGQPNS